MAKKLNDASIATITSLNNADYMNTVDASTGEISKILVSNVKTSIGALPLIYATNLTQASTSAPTASTPVNNIGATITYARTSAGVYTATASAAVFTANKTFVFLQNIFDTAIVKAEVASTTVINIGTRNAGDFSGQDALLDGNSFKIEIYP